MSEHGRAILACLERARLQIIADQLLVGLPSQLVATEIDTVCADERGDVVVIERKTGFFDTWTRVPTCAKTREPHVFAHDAARDFPLCASTLAQMQAAAGRAMLIGATGLAGARVRAAVLRSPGGGCAATLEYVSARVCAFVSDVLLSDGYLAGARRGSAARRLVSATPESTAPAKRAEAPPARVSRAKRRATNAFDAFACET